ncbi:unnamed protein product [Gongylonema pulchrum]|uniref:Ovule protein n=1 Tax=Gongylonema pulchrum TaxID=637853 RepID=A0A183D8Z4_9BILA|nr:unnamed protein product [Gongylonema pulchrum]
MSLFVSVEFSTPPVIEPGSDSKIPKSLKNCSSADPVKEPQSSSNFSSADSLEKGQGVVKPSSSDSVDPVPSLDSLKNP